MSVSLSEPTRPSSLSRKTAFEQLASLLGAGRLLQAYQLAQTLGDCRQWRDAEELALAVSLVAHWGAPRLSDALSVRCYRNHPHSPDAKLLYVRYLLSRKGHYRAWQFWQAQAGLSDAPAPLRAEWLGFGARLNAMLRDFERSSALLQEMDALLQDHPWLELERSVCLEREDRHAEALEACQSALARYPDYRALIQQAARLELQLNRPAEALARLQAAASRLESASLCAQLSELLLEQDQLDQALAWLEREQELAPMREPRMLQWYAGRRCDIACLQGAYAEGRSWAEQAGAGFYASVGERLASPEGQRLLLPVNFVQQHHMTCAPATLSALSAYWERPVAHLEIAEEICYDGTTHQAERSWGERNGWLTLEFTVDWPTAKALIDRGIPFTLTLQYTGSGHLQAVVGYDEPRGTLLIRDPGQPQFGESFARGLLAEQAVSGPRGMLLLPPEETARLEGLTLPESELWTLYYRCLTALDSHQQTQARECLQGLQQQAPGHRLSLQAERALAWYDGDEGRALAATEVMLERYPQDSNLILSKASSLSVLRSRQDQLDWLATVCQGLRPDPALWLRYAQLLSEDGRQEHKVAGLLLKSLTCQPLQASAWSALASLNWDRHQREDAVGLYRIAACLQSSNEHLSAQYFRALRCLGRTDEGLAFLRQRQQRMGRFAAGPSLTLADFLEELEEPALVGEVLQTARGWRPDDAELALALVDFSGRVGNFAQARQVLQQCETVCRRSQWLRASALLAQRTGEGTPEALAGCREAVALEPLNLSLQRMCLDLIRQVEGDQLADEHVQAQIARFPHHRGLLELGYERAQRQSPEQSEQALRRLLASHPHYAWGLRELAVCLARQGRTDEAQALADEVLLIDPTASSSHSTAGFVHLQAGRREEAEADFIQSLRLSADNDYASDVLLDIAGDHAQSVQRMGVIHDELVRQVTFGDGWLAYQYQAQGRVEEAQLTAQLREAQQQRADLWQTWVALARQLVHCGQQEEAEALLLAGRERFPLLPRMAYEWALLLKQRGEREQCLQALEQSFMVNAFWGMSVKLYVDVLLELGGRLEQAEQVLRRVLLRTPDNSELRAYLAYVLGERGAYAVARQEAERVLRLEPGNGWAWGQLRRYSAELAEPERALQLARDLVGLRRGDVDAWVALAEHEVSEDEREAALHEALRLNPRHRLANERMLELLLGAGRVTALQALLDQPCWNGVVPAELQLFRARAVHAQGDLPEACAQLQSLLNQQPQCYVGWRYLADWREQAEDMTGYVQAAREMVRLEAMSALAQGYLGHALLLAGQRSEALVCFERAAQLDPGYLFAQLNAFDLNVEQGRFEQAHAGLTAMLRQSQEAPVWLRALRLAVAQESDELRREALLELMTRADAADLWSDVLKAYPKLAQDRHWGEQLAGLALSGRLHTAAARSWLELEALSWRPDALWRAFEKGLAGDQQHALKLAMLNLLAERDGAGRQLARVLERCREAAAVDESVWAAATYAMLRHELFYMMRAWLPAWRGRDVPAWALDNLAVALRMLGDDQEATVVSAAALEREPGNRDAMLWLAVDAGLRADVPAVEAWLARSGDEPLRPFFQCLRLLLDGWIAARQAGDSRLAVPHWRHAKAVAGEAHPAFRRLRKQLIRDLCRPPFTSGGARLWRYLQLRF